MPASAWASRSRCLAVGAVGVRATAMSRRRRSAAIRGHISGLVTSDRPRGYSEISEISRSAPGDTLPPSTASSSPCLCSWVTTDSVSAARSSGWVTTTRLNRNRSSSRSSSWPWFSAAKANASPAICSSASVMSPELAQWARTVAATSASAASLILPCSRSTAIAPFSSAGRDGSASARRSPCSRSSRWSTENSSPPTVSAWPPSARAPGSWSLSSAKEARLTPRITVLSSLGPPRPDPAVLLQVVQEPVDDPALPGLVGERLADDPAGQVGGQGPDLTAQRGERLLALGLDLLVGRLGQAAGLGLGLLAHLGDDLGALLAGLFAPPRCLVPGCGQLLPVLLEHLLRLGLGLFGVLQAALDLLGPLRQHLLGPRQQQPAEEAEDEEERDDPDDELGPGRNQWVL